MKITTRSSLLLFILIVHLKGYTQLTSQWTRQIGAKQVETGRLVATDTLGNVYCLGNYSDSVDFDPGSNTLFLNPSTNFHFIAKYSPTGSFLWAKKIPTTNPPWFHSATDMEVSTNNEIYISGVFIGTADFDPGSGTQLRTSNGLADIFILKLDSGGNFIWVQTFGGKNYDQNSNISIDKSGNLLVTGFFTDVVDFDPGNGSYTLTTLPNNGSDFFITKFTSTGNFLWAISAGGTNDEFSFAVTTDPAKSVYVTGMFNSQMVDFDPGPGTFTLSASSLYDDIFIAKYDSSGIFKWAKKIGSVGEDAANNIVSSGSQIFLTGYYQGTVDFDPGPSTYTQSGGEIFVSRFDTSGAHIWTKTFASIFYGNQGYGNRGHQVRVSNSGIVTASGLFAGIVDFNPSPSVFSLTSFGKDDVFYCLLDINGNFLCAGQIGSNQDDWTNTLALDNSGSIFGTGAFSSTADLDPDISNQSNFTSKGEDDIFLVKISSCINVYSGVAELSDNKADIIIRPNPNNGDFVIDINKAEMFGNKLTANIYDLSGRVVFSKIVDKLDQSLTISLSVELSPGLYYLDIKSLTSTVRKKLVIGN